MESILDELITVTRHFHISKHELVSSVVTSVKSCVWLKSKKPLLWNDVSHREVVQISNILLEPKKCNCLIFWNQKIFPRGTLNKQHFPIHKHWVYMWKIKNFIMEIRKATWMITKMHSIVALSAAHNCSSFPFWWSQNRQVPLTV